MNRRAVRVFFEKNGRAVYISHLDLMRTMQRTLKRSGLPIWYSEGFNPRIYLNFPLALSLGVEGTGEPMDFYVLEDIPMEDIVIKMNSVMPEGLKVTSADVPVHQNKEIGFAEYTAVFRGDADRLRAALDAFVSQEKIEVLKHSKKKGMITVDIKPHIAINRTDMSDNGISVDFRMPAGIELNLNAGILTDAFTSYCAENQTACELICTKRTNIFCKNGEVFA